MANLSESERLEHCIRCTHKGFDAQQGVVCGLTRLKPTFTESCPDYSPVDSIEKQPSISVTRGRSFREEHLSKGVSFSSGIQSVIKLIGKKDSLIINVLGFGVMMIWNLYGLLYYGVVIWYALLLWLIFFVTLLLDIIFKIRKTTKG